MRRRFSGFFSMQAALVAEQENESAKLAFVKIVHHMAQATRVMQPGVLPRLPAQAAAASFAAFFHRLRQRRFLGVFTGDPNFRRAPARRPGRMLAGNREQGHFLGPSPSANLVGKGKGDPLGLRLRPLVPTVSPMQPRPGAAPGIPGLHRMLPSETYEKILRRPLERPCALG